MCRFHKRCRPGTPYTLDTVAGAHRCGTERAAVAVCILGPLQPPWRSISSTPSCAPPSSSRPATAAQTGDGPLDPLGPASTFEVAIVSPCLCTSTVWAASHFATSATAADRWVSFALLARQARLMTRRAALVVADDAGFFALAVRLGVALRGHRHGDRGLGLVRHRAQPPALFLARPTAGILAIWVRRAVFVAPKPGFRLAVGHTHAVVRVFVRHLIGHVVHNSDAHSQISRRAADHGEG